MLILVRHAESMPPGPGWEDEFTRPLSEEGHRQAQRLAPTLASLGVSALFTSPYLRARQTLEPFSIQAGLEIATEPDFREHRMSDVPISNWKEVLRHQWDDLDFVPPQGESMRDSMVRGLSVVQRLISLPGVTALAGHGTTISLILHSTDPSFAFDEHLAMTNPALYRLDLMGGVLRWEALPLGAG